MRRTEFFNILPLAISLMLCIPSLGVHAQVNERANWAESIEADYDVRPNVVYNTANNTPLKLDLYLNLKRSAATPTLIFFHWGGWVAGSKEDMILSFLPYIEKGWNVVNVEYRLASNSPAPGAVEDCRCSLKWVIQNAKELKIETSRIVLVGSSVGGHLALITGMLPSGSKFDRSCPVSSSERWRSAKEPELKVAAIISWFGLADVSELLEGPNAKNFAIEWFGNNDNRMALAKELSPMTYVRKGQPPIISIHGDDDYSNPYPQIVKFHEASKAVGVPNQLVTIPKGGHGDFNHEQLATSYAAIWKFLKDNKVTQ